MPVITKLKVDDQVLTCLVSNALCTLLIYNINDKEAVVSKGGQPQGLTLSRWIGGLSAALGTHIKTIGICSM